MCVTLSQPQLTDVESMSVENMANSDMMGGEGYHIDEPVVG